jgi:predicted nucleic acid-binding protein
LTLVDTNVLLDVTGNDPVWAGWSLAQLKAAALAGPLIANSAVYAELSVRFPTIEALDAMLATLGARLEPIPHKGLFLAAKAFTVYRTRGGHRSGVLPDFFIGGHAVAAGIPLLTRDRGRFADYFPGIMLIAPDPLAI